MREQQKKMRLVKDAHDDHALRRSPQAPRQNFLAIHPREAYNLEWQRRAALKRARSRQSLGSFIRPGSP